MCNLCKGRLPSIVPQTLHYTAKIHSGRDSLVTWLYGLGRAFLLASVIALHLFAAWCLFS